MTSAFKRRGDERKESPELFAAAGRSKERAYFYSAVRYLRGLGISVLRISHSQHRVDGKMFTNRQVTGLARKKGWSG